MRSVSQWYERMIDKFGLLSYLNSSLDYGTKKMSFRLIVEIKPIYFERQYWFLFTSVTKVTIIYLLGIYLMVLLLNIAKE